MWKCGVTLLPAAFNCQNLGRQLPPTPTPFDMPVFINLHFLILDQLVHFMQGLRSLFYDFEFCKKFAISVAKKLVRLQLKSKVNINFNQHWRTTQ